jgi:hypothetical protein
VTTLTQLKSVARCGDDEAAKRLSSLLVTAGRLDDAISWLAGHLQRDANDTLRQVAESLERNGRPMTQSRCVSATRRDRTDVRADPGGAVS